MSKTADINPMMVQTTNFGSYAGEATPVYGTTDGDGVLRVPLPVADGEDPVPVAPTAPARLLPLALVGDPP